MICILLTVFYSEYFFVTNSKILQLSMKMDILKEDLSFAAVKKVSA